MKDFNYTDNMRYTALYLLFSYFWTSEFIVAMGQVLPDFCVVVGCFCYLLSLMCCKHQPDPEATHTPEWCCKGRYLLHCISKSELDHRYAQRSRKSALAEVISIVGYSTMLENYIGRRCCFFEAKYLESSVELIIEQFFLTVMLVYPFLDPLSHFL